MEKLDIYEHADVDLYDFTDDQIQVMLELDLMQRESSEYPDVEVRARLDEINKALADDPTPLDSQRNIRVAFKPSVVDLIVPPDPYSSEEEEDNENENEPANEDRVEGEFSDDEDDREIARIDSRECDKAAVSRSGDDSSDTESIDENSVEKDNAEWMGKMEDKVAESGEALSSPPSSDRSSLDQPNTVIREDEPEDTVVKNSGSFSHLNDTATDLEQSEVSENSKLTYSRLRRKKQAPLALPTAEDENSASTFHTATTSTDKKPRRKSKTNKEMEADEKTRKEVADVAFQAWLRQKRQKAKEMRQKLKKERESEMKTKQETESQSSVAINEWFKRKRKQERQLQAEQKRQVEELQRQNELRMRSRHEVELAYDNWVRSKNRQALMAQYEEKRREMITRLSFGTTRRSHLLALALNSSCRFVDYYGYR